MGYRMALLAWS